MTGADDQREQFENVYRLTNAPLLAYLLRRTPSPHDAADLLAEVYLIAWRRRQFLPPADEQRLWLFGVARNVLANHQRRLIRDRSAVNALARQLSRQLPVREPDAETTRVQAALRTLGDDDRELITLTAWEGLTPAQIAIVTDRAPGTVRVLLHRARARLRSALAEIDHDDRSGASGTVGAVCS